MKLGGLRALLPDAVLLILTATISSSSLLKLREVLMLNQAKTVRVSPDRPNIYLNKFVRLSSNDQFKSHMKILGPIAKDLNILREDYPVTIIFLKLKYCGLAFRMFKREVEDSYSEEEGTYYTFSLPLMCEYDSKCMRNQILKDFPN